MFKFLVLLLLVIATSAVKLNAREKLQAELEEEFIFTALAGLGWAAAKGAAATGGSAAVSSAFSWFW